MPTNNKMTKEEREKILKDIEAAIPALRKRVAQINTALINCALALTPVAIKASQEINDAFARTGFEANHKKQLIANGNE